MRALLLLFLVVLAFLLVRWFYPVSTAEAQGPDPESGARFLALPVQSSRSAAQAMAPAALEPERGLQPAAPSSRRGADDAELPAAAALVHGSPEEVERAATPLPPDRALLAESYAWALAGEKQLAHSLAGKIDKEAVGGRERALLEAALTGKAAAPAASGEAGALQLAMELGLAAREAAAELAAGNHAAAARRYSEVLVAELEAPWEADARTLKRWTAGLDEAQRRHRWSPRGAWPAVEVEVKNADSPISIRKRYVAEHPGALMCTGLIERSNDLRGYLQPGQVLRIPTDPVHVLVDLGACWALYFFGDEVAGSWPVGIGRAGQATPAGDYVATDKLENPPWMKVGQEPIPFGDPRNPLGTRWIGWGRDGRPTSLGFHGTREPGSVGGPSSDGCVRFLNEDIEVLFQILPEGAPIRVRS